MKRVALLSSILIAAAAMLPAVAEASCDDPTPELVWSWPADGASEVPTNSRLWAIGVRVASVSLNDEIVYTFTNSRLRGDVELPELTPNTSNTITYTFRDYNGMPPPTPVVTTFTTGDGPALEAPVSPVIDELALTDYDQTPEGNTILFAGDCLDGGSAEKLKVDTTTDVLVLRLDRRVGSETSLGLLWPVDEGLPAWFRGTHCALSERECKPDAVSPDVSADTCFVLVAIGPSGLESRSAPWCPSDHLGDDDPPDTDQDVGGMPQPIDGDEGCTITASHTSPASPLPLALAMVVGLFLTIRARRRGTSTPILLLEGDPS